MRVRACVHLVSTAEARSQCDFLGQSCNLRGTHHLQADHPCTVTHEHARAHTHEYMHAHTHALAERKGGKGEEGWEGGGQGGRGTNLPSAAATDVRRWPIG